MVCFNRGLIVSTAIRPVNSIIHETLLQKPFSSSITVCVTAED